MEHYNCYGYAIDDHRWLYTGNSSGNPYTGLETIDEFSEKVTADIKAIFNYQCIKQDDIAPTSNTGWINVIALKADTEKEIYDPSRGYRVNDFHFAKFFSSSDWRHKPGSTAVLRFLQPIGNMTVWPSEGVIGDEYFSNPMDYDSPTVYFSYKASHGNTTPTDTWTGNHYHSGSVHYYEYQNACVDCDCFVSGTTSWKSLPCTGPNCIMPWSLETENDFY